MRYAIRPLFIRIITILMFIALVSMSTVVTKADGEFVRCQMRINGVPVGHTPYIGFLGFGAIEVELIPPQGYEQPKFYYRYSLGQGAIITEKLIRKGPPADGAPLGTTPDP